MAKLVSTPSAPPTGDELDFERVLGRPMHTAEARSELVDFVAQGRNPAFDLTPALIAERLPRMVALLLMSPDFQWR